MEKRLLWTLNVLGVAACVATLVLSLEVWELIRPLETTEGLENIHLVLHPGRENPLVPPESHKKIKGTPESARDVAAEIKVIKGHIEATLLKSYKNFGGLSRDEYTLAIAEAIVAHTKTMDDAFWVTGMAQTESSFRITAKPPKHCNSSARGLLQVIRGYHADVLDPASISKDDLGTNIDKSVLGGVLVFYKYLYPKRGRVKVRTLPEATRRYRSLSASEAEQMAYYNAINSVFQKLMSAYRKEVDKK